jgi:hypothetical protein
MQPSNQIPYPLLELVARIITAQYSRSMFVGFFYEAGAVSHDPNSSNKLNAAMAWLRKENDANPDPLAFLARLFRDFFDGEPVDFDGSLAQRRTEVREALPRFGLQYVDGGSFLSAVAGPASINLADLIARRDFPAVVHEFERSTANVATEPREAASAAANMLEAICKEYIIHYLSIEQPRQQDLAGVWNVVRNELKLDPKSVEDDDLRRVLGDLEVSWMG